MAEADERPYALDVIRHWPDAAREAAYGVLLAHGAPDPVDPGALRWEHLRPWKRVVVCAVDEPEEVVESVIDAEVPQDRRAAVDAVAGDFHITVEDDGELSVRGPDLKTNVLTLNVVHAIVYDGLSPDDARARRDDQLAALREGHPPDDAEELHFADDAAPGEPRTITPRTPPADQTATRGG
jgi:hypothetical protein